jgi:EpsD family peptidyl-prolyl cis-trans isomerase
MYNETNLFATSHLSRIGKFALLIVMLGLMASCSKKNGDEKTSQSIVRVNGDEITIHQLNNELQRANVQPSQQDAAGKQISQKLVDRQILVQEALKNKLDRNPRVMDTIENAKLQILAQAYIEDKVSSIAKPTEAEIADYHVKHTDIFANRKVYVMDEVMFAVGADKAAEFKSLSDSAKTMDDVIKWLEANQIKSARTQTAHAAETLPPELLSKLSKMAVGDLIFINANGRTVAGRLVETKQVPISDTDAKPLIERILTGQKRKQAAEAEMKRLRTAAKIEYLNKKFEPTDVSSAQQTSKPSESSSPVLAEPSKPAESIKPAGDAKAQGHIEKGISGL